MKSNKDIGLEFNEFSKNYTNDMIGLAPHYLDLVSCFNKHLPENFNPKTILDLGCGNGNITARLLQHYPNASYHLVDASAEMIGLCQKQFSDYKVSYANTYFKDFNFQEGTFDLIVAGFSLHHCEDNEKRTVFRNIYDALKKNGIFSYSDLMISKTNPDHPKVLEDWGDLVNTNYPDGEKWAWVMEHYEKFDRPTDHTLQIKWLKNAGFTRIQIPFQAGYWIYLQAVKF